MGARGPKSTTELTVIRRDNVVSIERPRAPGHLSPEERAEWTRIVDAQPADWLTAGLDVVLAGYCRWTIVERREGAILSQIMAAEEFDEDAYNRALQRLERASRYLASAAVRLGFAHTVPRTTKNGGRKKSPLQFSAADLE